MLAGHWLPSLAPSECTTALMGTSVKMRMALSPFGGDWCRVARCSRARRVPPDRSPEGCQAKQPAIHGSSQSGQPHFHIARHNIACNARPPSFPPSFFPSSARLLVRSFVACFLWPLYSPPQLTVCSVLLPDRTEATEEGRGECKQRPRRGRARLQSFA